MIKRIPQEENDDELSIAMFAFYEAIMHYNEKKGSFIKLAEVAIRNRRVDYIRKEQRHKGTLSLETPVYEGGDEEAKRTIMEGISAGKSEIDRSEEIMVAADEIQQFGCQLMEFGITLTEVAEACPKDSVKMMMTTMMMMTMMTMTQTTMTTTMTTTIPTTQTMRRRKKKTNK